MTDDERKHPNDVPFDLSDDLAQVAFHPETDDIRVVAVPLAVRLIDDNDVWRHSLPESKLFASAWGVEEDTSPMNLIFWQELLYEGPKAAYDMIDHGELIYKFMENQSKSVMHNAFEVTIDGIKGIAVNCPFGNSRLFGDKYNEYSFVVKFSQSAPDRWRYTFYANDESTVDCSEMVKKHFNELNLAGGHAKAAGATISKNVFADTTTI